MKKQAYSILLILSALVMTRCSEEYPIDEDGLLITTRTSAYVGSFELLGPDFQTVRTKVAEVDTIAQTIYVEVHFGTDLRRLYPQFSLVTDAKLEPKITGFVDFSNPSTPMQWTVISGNRQIRKTYTVNLTVQQPTP